MLIFAAMAVAMRGGGRFMSVTRGYAGGQVGNLPHWRKNCWEDDDAYLRGDGGGDAFAF
jgi:hypothetical protein